MERSTSNSGDCQQGGQECVNECPAEEEQEDCGGGGQQQCTTVTEEKCETRWVGVYRGYYTSNSLCSTFGRSLVKVTSWRVPVVYLF